MVLHHFRTKNALEPALAAASGQPRAATRVYLSAASGAVTATGS
ncbi:hypothetical protein [Allokutzneria oryzae]|uniref:TetR family transcriptional regulator n=1 Tax=Allokutzneria oryzae TaxID=1378989 RepID=A0ABV5ZS00_9PSEU